MEEARLGSMGRAADITADETERVFSLGRTGGLRLFTLNWPVIMASRSWPRCSTHVVAW